MAFWEYAAFVANALVFLLIGMRVVHQDFASQAGNPLLTGVVVRCRPLGVLKMTDEGGQDAKLLAVPVDKLCTLYRSIKDYKDLPELTIKQISHFFEHYKDLEPNKWVKVQGWEGIEAARAEIMAGTQTYQQSPDKPSF